MPGLHRRSPLKGLKGWLSPAALLVIPSRREESPPRIPTVVREETGERCFAAAQHDRGSCAEPTNVRILSPFSGLRLRSPGILSPGGPRANPDPPTHHDVPRARSRRRPVRDSTIRSPGPARGDVHLRDSAIPFPGTVGATSTFGIQRSLPRAGSGRQPARGSAFRSLRTGAGRDHRSGSNDPFPGRGSGGNPLRSVRPRSRGRPRRNQR